MNAIFLDKDGTLIEDVPYNVDPERISLLPGAASGLRALHAAGYGLIVVSNQSGIARGIFPELAMLAVEQRVRQLLLTEAGVPLTAFYYCPHHPEGKLAAYRNKCTCRKPQPGLLLQAAAQHSVNLHASWMIGDILDDVEAGRAAGCRTILIDNGHETEWQLTSARRPDLTARDLSQAACLIGTRAGAQFATSLTNLTASAGAPSNRVPHAEEQIHESTQITRRG